MCATVLMGMQGWSTQMLRGEGKRKEEEAAVVAEE
jgi:hypothetical protein